MADEQYVNRDQHRADLTGLRSEVKEEIAGLRQDVAVIAKTVEMGFAELRQQMGELRQELHDMRQELRDTRQELHQDIREVRTTSQLQLWVLIAVVIVTMVGGMIKMVFFP
jgi:predicted  nucleic acid-binding Zn-ribbon protein